MILRTSIKFWPAEYHSQSAIEAALLLRKEIGDAASVRAMTIESHDASVDIIGSEPEKWKPETRETADHSFNYLVSIALLEGDVTVEGFKKERWMDPTVTAMMERINILPDESLNVHVPGTFPCVLEFATERGEQRRVEMFHAPGSAKNRMSQAQVESKFRNSCGIRLPI